MTPGILMAVKVIVSMLAILTLGPILINLLFWWMGFLQCAVFSPDHWSCR